MLSALWLSLVVPAHALPPLPPPMSGGGELRRQGGELCYPNGLRVTVLTDDRQPVVSVIAVVDGGSRLDPQGKAGTAHLMEHLWFRARTPSGAQVHQVLMALGAHYNATTADDVITFQTTAAREALPALLTLEAQRQADALGKPDPGIVAEERRIVLSERTLRSEVDWDAAVDLLGFGAPAETVDTLAAVDVGALAAVADRWKAPLGTTLVLRGAITSTEADAALRAAFGEARLMKAHAGAPGCKQPPAAPAAPPVPPRPEQLPVKVEAIHTPMILVGWQLPSAYTVPGVEAQLRLAALAANRRLNLEFASTESDAETFAPACGLNPGFATSHILCGIQAPRGRDANRLFARLVKAVSTANPAEDAWLDRMIYATRVEAILSLSNLDVYEAGPVDDALRNHFRRQATASGDLIGSWYGLTLANITQATRAWLGSGGRGALFLPPGEDPARYLGGEDGFTASGSGASRAAESADSAFSVQGHARQPPGSYTPTGAPTPPRPIAWKQAMLQNGLQVIAVQHGAGQSFTGLRFRAGPPFEERPGLDAWTWERTWFNTEALLDHSFARTAARYGARFNWYERPGQRILEASGDSAGLSGQLWVLAAAAEGAFLGSDSEWLAEARRAWDEVPGVLSASPDVQAAEARGAHLFGADSPHARHPFRNLIAAQSSPEATVKRHFQTWWHPKNATLVIVSDAPPESALALATSTFAAWNPKAGSASPVAPTLAEPPTSTIRRWFPREGVTTTLTVACRVPPVVERGVAQVASSWLESVAWRVLRESEVAAYTPSVGLRREGAAAWLELRVETLPSVTRAAADRWLAAITTPPDADATARALDRVRREQLLGLVDTGPVFHRVIGADAWGVTPLSAEEIAAATPAAVGAWVRGCAAGAAITAVGPSDPFAP